MRLAAAGLLVVVMVSVAGAGPAKGSQAVDTTLAYTCTFPSGSHQVPVRVEAMIPATGAVNEPIQPTNVTATVTIPQAGLSDLTKLGAATVSATAELAIVVTQNGTSTNATWSDLAAPATSIPEAGGLTIAAAGTVPPVRVDTPGDVTVAAGDLDVFLTPKKVDGSATDPMTVHLACILDPNQNATMATISVPRGSSSPTPGTTAPSTKAPSPATTGRPDQRPAPAFGQLRATPRKSRPGPAPATQGPSQSSFQSAAQPGTDSPRFDPNIYSTCADLWNAPPGQGIYKGFFVTSKFPLSVYVDGYSNVRKLIGALRVGPAFSRGEPPATGLRLGVRLGEGDQCQVAKLNLDHDGKRRFPPIEATFATFGLMPVTATAHLTQAGPEPITQVAYEEAPFGENHYTVIVEAKISLRLSDVTVNGEPLDVGPQCRTTRSLHTPDNPIDPDAVVLVGGSAPTRPEPRFESILFGGALVGVATIPPFTGCVSPNGEDLDPLLTATISGPDNYIKLTQGPVCAVISPPRFCPVPPKPDPAR